MASGQLCLLNNPSPWTQCRCAGHLLLASSTVSCKQLNEAIKFQPSSNSPDIIYVTLCLRSLLFVHHSGPRIKIDQSKQSKQSKKHYRFTKCDPYLDHAGPF